MREANPGVRGYDTEAIRWSGIKKIRPMLSSSSREELRAFYTEGQERGMVVDHVVPLEHAKVCGLHVIANLQYLTRSENTQKGGRFLTDWDRDDLYARVGVLT